MEKLTIAGIDYQIREVPMREMLPVFDKELTGTAMSVEVCKLAVMRDGKPLGDAVLDLGFGAYNKLMTRVSQVNGLADEEKN